MAKGALLQLKIDSLMKKQADTLFAEIGLDTPTAIRIFLKRAIMHRGIPFDVVYENSDDCPQCKNLLLKQEPFDEADKIREDPDRFKTYSNFSEIVQEIESE